MRRYLYFFVIIAVIILAVLVFLFLRNRAASPANTNPGVTPSGLPGVGTQSNPPPPGQTTPGGTSGSTAPAYTGGQKFGVVAQNQVISYYVDPQNNAIIVQPDGQIVKISNGGAVTLSSSVISNLISADFSYDGNKILASFGDPANPQFSVFDVASKSWNPLALGAKNAVWSPTNYQIAYLGVNGGTKILTTLDISNAKAKPVALFSIHAEDLTLNWIGPDRFILSDKGSAAYAGSIWSFDAKSKTLTPFVQSQLGATSLWDSKASMGLVFTTGPSGGSLALLDAAGNALHGLSFNTMPSKCAFDTIASSTPMVQLATSTTTSTKKSKTPVPAAPPIVLIKTLYCAVPRDSQTFGASRLPDDYEKKAVFTTDDVYKVGLSDGSVSQVFADHAQQFDASDLKVFAQTLFFVNRTDQKLYAISLK